MTGERSTRLLPASAEAICEAACCLRDGGLIVLPTETVYGLGADAENISAIEALFAAKGRPADHPLIVHLASAALIERYAAEVPEQARQLAAAFWPGPLTMILKSNGRISRLVTGGQATIGLRVPRHPVAQALLQEFAGPIAAPSANRFGRVSSTSAAHAFEELAGRVDLILDGGECEIGLESTIVDFTSGSARLLRPGGVTAEQIAAVLHELPAGHSPESPRVSGSLASHYAPRATVEIVSEQELLARAEVLASQGLRVAVLLPEDREFTLAGVNVLSLPAAEAELAHVLYARLREVDEIGCDIALATLPAATGLGLAIADRLRRAAGPRTEHG